MKIDPNVTPDGILMDEIRELTLKDSDIYRLFWEKERKDINIPFVKTPTVYFQDEFGDSRYFAPKIAEMVSGDFLEIGSGTGVVIITVALTNLNSNSIYVATDINPKAVVATRLNAIINGIEDKIDCRVGDVFSCINADEKFDYIFWNHPFHKGNEDESMIMRACFDPGFQGFEAYIRDGHNYLKPNGKLLIGSGNFADLEEMKRIISKHDLRMNLIDFISSPFNVTKGEYKTFNIYEIHN